MRISFPDRCFKLLGKRVAMGVASGKMSADKPAGRVPAVLPMR